MTFPGSIILFVHASLLANAVEPNTLYVPQTWWGPRGYVGEPESVMRYSLDKNMSRLFAFCEQFSGGLQCFVLKLQPKAVSMKQVCEPQRCISLGPGSASDAVKTTPPSLSCSGGST